MDNAQTFRFARLLCFPCASALHIYKTVYMSRAAKARLSTVDRELIELLFRDRGRRTEPARLAVDFLSNRCPDRWPAPGGQVAITTCGLVIVPYSTVQYYSTIRIIGNPYRNTVHRTVFSSFSCRSTVIATTGKDAPIISWVSSPCRAGLIYSCLWIRFQFYT